MTANAGYHAYATGDVLTAAQVQYNLQNQTVMYFATTTARDAALTGAILVEGMVSYTPATGLMYYNGTAWVSVSGQANTPNLSNPVLNSAFQVWQRGTTSASITTAATYTADRWSSVSGVSTAMVVSRQATGDTTNLPNIQYCARVQKTAGQTGTSVLYFAQSFESINSIPFAGKTVTLSFYARKGANYSSATSVVSAYVQTGTGTDQNILSGGFTGSVNAIAQDSTLTTTWQRFTYTGTIGTTATQIGMFFSYTPVGTAGAADYFEVTGVQLELGSTATPFDTYATTIQGELAACQRYYYRLIADNLYANFGIGLANSTTNGSMSITAPVQMRTLPTSVDFSTLRLTDYSSTYAVSALVLDNSGNGRNTQVVSATTTGIVATRGYAISANNSTSGYLGFSAEL